MSNLSSDAIVFFGASGDLAYKQIFPSLLRLVRDEGMRVPIIGVAKSGWSLQNLKDRAKDSLEKHGGVDPDSLQLFTNLLRYVDGDYQDGGTSFNFARSWGARNDPSIIWPCRRVCSLSWRKGWRNQAVRQMDVW
jgi:glucose-6-phosphate 1-dehydrogenase